MKLTVDGAYAVVALAFGAAMALVSPPFQSPDEPEHFHRALALSEGRVFPTREGDQLGGWCDAATIEWVRALTGDLPFHPENKQTVARLRSMIAPAPGGSAPRFAEFANTALWSPVPYAPQVVALAVARAAGLPLLAAFYLARLANLIACALLCWWGLRQLPYGQVTAAMIALSPMFVFQTASMSADALGYAFTFAFSAAVLRALARERGPARAEVLAMAALGALMDLTKPAMALVPLLAVLLLAGRPARQVGRPWLAVGAIVAASWLPMIAWNLALTDLYVPLRLGVDPARQAALILADPAGFVRVLWDTLRTRHQFYTWTAVGHLGWLDTPLSGDSIHGFYLVLLASGLVWSAPAASPGWQVRALAAALLAGSHVLISLLIYLSWARVGDAVIDGVQGRYYLPFAALWAALLQWPASLRQRAEPALRAGLAAASLSYSVLFLAHALRMLVRRYWQ